MIQTEDLSKQFGNFWAVDGVNIQVRPGHVLALLGQNGAGKTTTVRMLSSVLLPTRGRAIVAGYDVLTQPDLVRAHVGVLTEQHGLYLRMSGFEYLDYFGQIYRLKEDIRRKRCASLLESFGLTDVSTNPIGQYSKGMRQKLALARTLIHEPPVLLLDEPTSAMDPESAQLVRSSIADLRSDQRTIVICTHNLSEAELLADQIAIIYRGRILVYGSVNELKQKMFGPVEYDILVSGVWPDGHLVLPDGIDPITTFPSGMRYRVVDPQMLNPLLINELVGRGVEVVAVQEVRRTLEQVYLQVMKQVEDI